MFFSSSSKLSLKFIALRFSIFNLFLLFQFNEFGVKATVSDEYQVTI